MSVTTTYDDYRNKLKEMVDDCLEYTRDHLLDKKVWGSEDMRPGYAIDIYKKIEDLRESI